MNNDSPRNDVERLLVEMLQGQIDPEDFARRLLNMQIFMPVKDEKYQIMGFQSSTKAQPLIVDDEEGNRIMVTFSAPERAKALAAEFPGYSGGLLADTHWIVRRMAQGMGLTINPGMEPGFDFDADMVAMLVGLLPEDES